jgi:hypothetical protein
MVTQQKNVEGEETKETEELQTLELHAVLCVLDRRFADVVIARYFMRYLSTR